VHPGCILEETAFAGVACLEFEPRNSQEGPDSGILSRGPVQHGIRGASHHKRSRELEEASPT